MNKYLSYLIFSTLLLLALACGGGGGGGESSVGSTASLRLAAKSGDTLSVYSLSGNLIGSPVEFDASGSASVTVSTNASYILKLNIGGNALLETIVTKADFQTSTLNVAMNGATTWATKKVMMSSSDNLTEDNISSLLSSASGGLTSIYDLTLSTASSKLSSSDLEEVKLYSLVNGMVIKAIDNGEFNYSWDSLSYNMLSNFDADSTTSAETILQNAESLAGTIRTQIPQSTALTIDDFDTGLIALLGTDTDAKRMIAGIQAGDASTTLSVLNSSGSNQSSDALYSLGISALEAEDMVQAYQYFAAAITANPNDAKARFLLATTRVLSLSLKGTRGAKDMLSILSLEFDFINNDHLRNDDGDDIDAIDADIYEDPDDVAKIFSYDELEEYLSDVVLHELSLSIADLNQISSSDLPSSDPLVITPAMQGYIDEDENDKEILPSSNILVDIIDVYAVKGALELWRSKINTMLMNNLEVSNENDTGEGMKDLIIQGAFANLPYLDGSSTFALSDDYTGSNKISTDNLTSMTFKAGYPGELILSIDTPDGDKNILEAEEMDSEEIANFSSWHPNLTAISNPIYELEGELLLTLNNVPTQLNFQGAFEGNTFEFFQADVYENVDSNNDGIFEFNASYVLSANISGTGTLTFHSTYEHIDGKDVQEYITADGNFLTIKQSFATEAQTSLKNAFTIAVSTLEMLQNLGDNADRIDHIVDNKESLTRDDSTTFSDSEINNFQTFLDGVNDALDGEAMVDPSFLGSGNWTSQSLDLSVFFSTAAKTFFTDDQGNIVESTYNDPDTTDLLEASVRDQGNLFGQTASQVGGANISDIYSEFFGDVDDWFTLPQSSSGNVSSGNTSTSTNTTSTVSNKTTLSGTATFSDEFYPVMSMSGGGNTTGILTIQPSEVPGHVYLTDNENSQVYSGYINGLNIYAQGTDTVSNPNEPFSVIIAFTDTSFTKAVQLLTYKEGTSGTGLANMELALLTLDSGSLSAANLGISSLTGSAVMQHKYVPLGSSTTGFSSFNMEASGNSFLTYTDNSNSGNTFTLSTYGHSIVGSRVNNDSFAIMCGLFDGSNLENFSGFEVFYNNTDSYAKIHSILGTVANGSIALSHQSSVSYAGTNLTSSILFTSLNGTSETDDGTITITNNSELLTSGGGDTGMLMGPVIFLGKHGGNDYSLGVLIFSDSSYNSYFGPSSGYDGTAWTEFNRGAKSTGDLQYQP